MPQKNNSTAGAEDADLQQALLAAFGSEAADWLEDEEDQLATVEIQDTGLDEVLTKVTQAIAADGAPNAAIANSQMASDSETLQDVGPRHAVFAVGDQQFGIPLTGVREIDRCGKITVLPRTPNWLRGVTNLRGEILSVTDFRSLLDLPDDRQTVGEKIIVVHSERHNARTALVVDRVLGIRNLSGEQGPLAGLSDRIASFADSIAITDQAATVLIDPDQLLGCDELKSFSEK